MASLAAQTYRDFEVVIVDDGSPDETASEVRRLMALYPEIQIRLVSKANGGLPSARNYGIRASRGKFLLPLDADDRLAPVFIERTVAALATHPEASIAYTDIQYFGVREDSWRCGPFALDVELVENRIPYASLYRRKLFDALDGYDESFRAYGDWDFWIRAALSGCLAVHISEPLFNYRKRGENEGLLAFGNRHRDELLQKMHEKYHKAFAKYAKHGSPWRVLVSIPFFHPSLGGAETVALHVVSKLVEDGWDVEVLTGKLEKRTEFTVAGAKIIEHSGSPLEAAKAPKYCSEIRERIESGAYGRCLLFGEPENWVLWSLEGAKVPAGTRVLLQPLINIDGFGRWGGNEKIRARTRNVLRKADRVTVLTEGSIDAALCREWDINAVRIPNAVAPPLPEPGFRERHGIPADAFVILCVANFWPVKNHPGLIESIKGLEGNWRLVLIGGAAPDKEYANRVLEMAASDPRILLMGQRTAKDVSSAMAESDLVALASFGEVAPLCLLEAMSHGVPWIAALGTGGAHDYAGGILVPLRAFKTVIATFRDNLKIRQRFGTVGKEMWQSCHSSDVVGEAWKELLRNPDRARSLSSANALKQKCEDIHLEFLRLHLEQKTLSAPAPQGRVSFCVITGGKRPEKLQRLLQSIRAQQLPNFEIVIAGCCQSLAGVTSVPMQSEAERGQVSALRNAAAAASTGDVLVFCDDDIVLDNEWSRPILEGLKFADMATGRLLNPDGTRHWDWAELNVERGIHRMLPYGVMSDHIYLTSGLFAVRRYVWEAIRWNESLEFRKGEDVDFSQAAIAKGFSVRCCPTATACHDDVRYTAYGDKVLNMEDPQLHLRRHHHKQLGKIARNRFAVGDWKSAIKIFCLACARMAVGR